jgi:hypothetical protein
MRRLALDLAGAAFGFSLHHRDACAVHLDVEQRHGGRANLRQFQLFGLLNRCLFTRFDIHADGFGVAFHCLGGDINTGQQLELFAAVLETRFTAHHGHHAPHTR